MKALIKQTQADLNRLQSVTNEELIQALFDMTADHLSEIKYEGGLAYAKRMTDNDEVGYDFLTQTKFYWQWWKNEWAKRDAEFIELYSVAADVDNLYDCYAFLHNIYRLKSDELMQQKAASMVGYAFDEYHKTNRKEAVK